VSKIWGIPPLFPVLFALSFTGDCDEDIKRGQQKEMLIKKERKEYYKKVFWARFPLPLLFVIGLPPPFLANVYFFLPLLLPPRPSIYGGKWRQI
jgi:hypothetical protein